VLCFHGNFKCSRSHRHSWCRTRCWGSNVRYFHADTNEQKPAEQEFLSQGGKQISRRFWPPFKRTDVVMRFVGIIVGSSAFRFLLQHRLALLYWTEYELIDEKPQPSSNE
jgi:hypothetical protein